MMSGGVKVPKHPDNQFRNLALPLYRPHNWTRSQIDPRTISSLPVRQSARLTMRMRPGIGRPPRVILYA